MAGVDWGYFDRFDELMERYLPVRGQGETVATQIVTAVCKLVYKWYNDGDVFDNNYCLTGWCNDLSSYANWLAEYSGDSRTQGILNGISDCYNGDDYEELLKRLYDNLLTAEHLGKMDKVKMQGDIYKCKGEFSFTEYDDDGDEYDDDTYY